MRICVIGAGAAGICAARRIQEDATKNGILDMEIRVFEQSNQLGGTWVFDEAFDAHSSMYSNLRTNIPRELMAFDDFPFLASTPNESSFPRSEKVVQYLSKFAQPIQHLIQYNTKVLNVRKLANEKWEVEFKQKSTKIVKSELFDAIFVCNGHYSVPRLPDFVTKLDKGKLEWIHSHQYRRAEHFAGKNVAVVGTGGSGNDIVLQLVEHAKKVYFLHMIPQKSINGMHKNVENKIDACGLGLAAAPFYFHHNERPKNCEEKCRIVDATESSLILADGNELGIKDGLDVVIFCTGYRYSMPFLEKEDLIKCPENGSFVSPIWAKCVHVHHPRSLFIIGIPFPVLPFPMFESQIRLALALFHGRIQPPPIEEMLAEESDRLNTLKKESMPPKYFHKFPPDPNAALDYFDWLDEISGYGKRQRPPAIYAINEHFRKGRLMTSHYRDIRYVIKNEGQQFEVIETTDN